MILPSFQALTAPLAAAFIAASTPHAFAQPDFEQHSSVKVIFEHTGIAPDTTTTLALVMDLDPTYHTYAPGFNDTGAPLSVEWTLPEGVKVGEFSWPAPHRYVQPGGLLDHVYEHQLVVTAPVSIDPSLSVGETLVFDASVEWLVCDDQQCVPQFDEISAELPVVNRPEPSGDAGVFRAFRDHLGTLITNAREQPFTLEWQGRTLIVHSLNGDALTFLPQHGSAAPKNLLEAGHSDEGRLAIEFEPGSDRVLGWIRQEPAEKDRANSCDERPDLWLLNVRVGQKPMKIIGETRTDADAALVGQQSYIQSPAETARPEPAADPNHGGQP